MWKNNRAKSRTEAPRTTFFSLAEEKSTLMKESIEQLLSKVNRLISTAEQVTKIPKDNIHTVQRLDELPEKTAPNVASSNEYVAQLEQQKAKLSQMHSIEQKLKEAEKKLEDSEKKKLEDAKKVTQLQSANEKLQSANEKLQSTNEKLNEKMHLMESEMQFQTKDEVALKSSHEKSEDCAETQKKLTDQTETIENATKFLAKLDTSMLETIRVKGGDTFADALAPFADIKVVTSKDVKTDRGSNMGTIENLVTKVIAWEKRTAKVNHPFSRSGTCRYKRAFSPPCLSLTNWTLHASCRRLMPFETTGSRPHGWSTPGSGPKACSTGSKRLSSRRTCSTLPSGRKAPPNCCAGGHPGSWRLWAATRSPG